MEKEISEDSYCTTDEGEENEEEKGYESDTDVANQDFVGLIEKIKKDNIFKEIMEVGSGKEKPNDIDNVIITSRCCIKDTESNKDSHSFIEEFIEVPELTFKEKEISLDSAQEGEGPTLPKALVLGIQSMRKGEKAKIFVKSSYIFKHYDNVKNKLSESEQNLYSQLFYEDSFRNKMKNQKIVFEVYLHNFFVVQNLMDRQEIRKKILRNGTQWKYARNPDIVYYNLSCHYGEKIIYEKNNLSTEFDDSSVKLFEVEKRILQNVKIGELAEVTVKPSYMKDKNPEFLKEYELDNSIDTKFICEVLNVDIYDYVFKPDRDKFSKKKVLSKGIGRDSPDRESLINVKFQIKVNDKIIFNNFDVEDIQEYVKNTNQIIAYTTFREQINAEYHIGQLDDDEDYERDSKIFSLVDAQFPNLKTVDLRLYSVPIVMRKVLIHMKRNEVCYIRTNYIDYFSCDSVELNKFKNDKIEIFIHLYEFLHRPQFSKLSFENKLLDLSKMKEIANQFFKEGKYLRACKIYQNINYRFNYGQVFESNKETFEEKEKELKRTNGEVYDKLAEIRLSCHNNLASAKFKLGNYNSVYEVTNRILRDFEQNNLKAIYLHGKSCLCLKLYEEAIENLKRLNILCPENEEFKNSLKEAEELNRQSLQKQKNMFKKMIFSSNN